MSRLGQALSHWHQLIDGFDTSALEFFSAVEEAVRARAVPDAAFERVLFSEGGVGSAKREYLRIRRQRVAFDIGATPFGTGYFFSWWLLRLGPRHPWLWLLGAIGACFVWGLLVLATVTSMVASKLVGTTGAGSFLVLLVIASLPLGLVALGWGIREGHIFDEEEVLGIPVLGWLYSKIFGTHTYYHLDSALMFQESIRRAVNEVINGLLEEQGLRALSPDELKPAIRDLVR